ncbi:hypothetical protein HB662_08870 [Roseomonas frigidaquae]|uniref:Uncharacterized protein n=1 Tax=Falsiroseomonas frigidaquae TaxID=487318 RepID=A0ABX1EXV5_9PROT|nr:hypothetical protein [Falsiroseomonas frigidaquae]NKE44889.1 hypothetical protein [Falsiroseomonas frigidaquae]
MRYLIPLLLLLLATPLQAQPALLALAGAELLLPHLARSAPFPRALAVTQALTAGEADWQALLAPLDAVAEQGAPLPRQLAASFPVAARAAVLAEMGHPAEAGRLWHWMAGAMRLGARFGGGESPALAATEAAEVLLGRGELRAADQALATLVGPAAAALLTWRQGLARRLLMEDAATALAALATARAAPGHTAARTAPARTVPAPTVPAPTARAARAP